MPMRMLRESPARVRESMSRPIQSVPKGWAGQGARFLREKSVTMAALVLRMPATVTASRATAASRTSTRVRRR